MKNFLRPIMMGLALCAAFSSAINAEAQNREKYIISAKAGGINSLTGHVTVERMGTGGQEQLTAKDDLNSGDIVSTGANGRIEVLLNPGSYMRVDENSEFELVDASLDNLLIKLVKGNAIIEVASADDVRMAVNVETPQTEVVITRGGIYRFNILPSDATEIFVRKGRLQFGQGAENQVKGGQKVTIRYNRLEIAKFDKKNEDDLDFWSKDRAKFLAKANSQLQMRSLSAAFGSLSVWDAASSGLGYWVYSARFGSFCFLPYGGRYWSSPYGYDYTRVWYTGGYGWTGNGYYPPPSNGSTGGNNGGNTGGNTGGNSGANPPSAPPTPPPTMPPPQPPPVVSQPPPPPVNEGPAERGPRRDYTTQP